MEFLSVATAVYGLAKATAEWLDEHTEKEATVQQISTTISQIQTILFPFQSVHNDTTSHAHAEPQVLSCISSIGQSLRRTQEHLEEWERKPSSKVLAFISPLTVVSQLRDDDRELHQQLVVLIAAISILGYIGNHHPNHGDRPSAPLPYTPRISSPPTKHLDPSKTSSPPHAASDVQRFWNEYVGEKVSLVSTDDFFARLDLYLGYSANDRAKRVLKRRLDEFGAISPLNLERVVGKGSLRACVERLSESNPPMSHSILFELTPAIGTSSRRRMPLLLWIDDHPENNKHERIYARTLGINTIQFASTTAAQSFIKRSTRLLRQASADATVRLISDNSRRNSSVWPFPRPGEGMLRFLRRRSLAIPVLVYTGRTVRATRYVARYERAGSSVSAAVCFEFIRALAEGRTDDLEGLGYMM
ncbi:hypothetical protein D9615_009029 [Tricholomella constricta]|uniref:Uncharacterized protein n=1 Tax=Tricholomella constricta TaxID=117010 RepID=A0A8H5LYW7_9AGAR|nr:hypothetical protein D9615_009029 [Tricholomella constricta]